jgi:hypothetical protein
MNGKIMGNRVIKSLFFEILIILSVFSGHGAFPQEDGESKVIFSATRHAGSMATQFHPPKNAVGAETINGDISRPRT